MSATVAAAAALAAGATVVTATERLARTLRRRHDLARLAAGATAWPAADVLPAGGFVTRLLAASDPHDPTPPPDLPGPEATRLAWLAAVASAGSDAGAYATAAAEAWHAAGLWGLSPAQLRAASDSPDADAFCGWVERYRERLGAAGYADPHTVAWELATGRRPLRGPLPAELVLAGFDPLPPLYARLAARLAAAGVSVRTAAWPARAAHVAVRPAVDADAELEAAAVHARACLDARPGASVAIVVPDLAGRGAAVRRALLDVLDPGWRTRPEPGRRLAVSLGRPLAEYPVIHAALGWLALVAGDAPWTTVSQVLRSPFLGAPGEAGGRALAELALRESAAADPGVHAVVAALRGRAPATAADLERALARVAATPAAPPAAGAGVLAELLALGGFPGAAGGATTAQALAGLQELLTTVAGLERLTGRVGPRRLVGVLADLARQRTFEPESDIAPVQVLGALEADGHEFDCLWITGLAADRWPPAPRPRPLLPVVLQRQAGLPEASAPALRELWSRRFTRLTAAADAVVVSWAKWEGEAEVLPSPLVAGLPAGPEATAPPAATRPDRAAIAAAGTVELRADPAPPFAGRRVRGGARVLSLQATCPADAFAVARLGARELPPAPAPLGDAARGRLVHRLLQELYARPEARRGLGGLDDAALAAGFAAVAGPVLAGALPGADALAAAWRELEQARLWELVRNLRSIDAVRGEFTVAVEVARLLAVGDLEFSLRLDRVETHAAGDLVLDYKTGDARERDWLPPRPVDAQLPLYAQAAGVAGVGIVKLRPPVPLLAGFAAPDLADHGLRDPAGYDRGRLGDWAALTAAWQAALAALAAEFRAGDWRLDRARRVRAGDQFTLLNRRHELGPDLAADEDAAEEPA